MTINEPSVLAYVNDIFSDLTQIPGFKYQQIKMVISTHKIHLAHITIY